MAVLLLYEAPERARGVVSFAQPRYAQPFVTAPTVGVTVCAAEDVVLVLLCELVLELVVELVLDFVVKLWDEDVEELDDVGGVVELVEIEEDEVRVDVTEPDEVIEPNEVLEMEEIVAPDEVLELDEEEELDESELDEVELEVAVIMLLEVVFAATLFAMAVVAAALR